jgi:hypothetical protein
LKLNPDYDKEHSSNEVYIILYAVFTYLINNHSFFYIFSIGIPSNFAYITISFSRISPVASIMLFTCVRLLFILSPLLPLVANNTTYARSTYLSVCLRIFLFLCLSVFLFVGVSVVHLPECMCIYLLNMLICFILADFERKFPPASV